MINKFSKILESKLSNSDIEDHLIEISDNGYSIEIKDGYILEEIESFGHTFTFENELSYDDDLHKAYKCKRIVISKGNYNEYYTDSDIDNNNIISIKDTSFDGYISLLTRLRSILKNMHKEYRLSFSDTGIYIIIVEEEIEFRRWEKAYDTLVDLISPLDNYENCAIYIIREEGQTYNDTIIDVSNNHEDDDSYFKYIKYLSIPPSKKSNNLSPNQYKFINDVLKIKKKMLSLGFTIKINDETTDNIELKLEISK